MKRTLLISITLLIFLGRSLAQETDEFQFEDSGIELNQSSENSNPSEELNVEPVPDISPVGDSSASQAPFEETSKEATQETETSFDLSKKDTPEGVIVREESTELAPMPSSSGTDLVEIRYPQDVFLPYKQRQKEWSWIFQAGTETTRFPDLFSQIYDAPASDYFRANLPMFSVELGPKFNFTFGAIAIHAGYGAISTQAARFGFQTELEIKRYTLASTFYLDALFTEPYFVPYLTGGFWQADYRETTKEAPAETIKISLDGGYLYRIGALFNLDWIEKDRSRETRRKTGIQGTFLNVYASSATMAESDPDPNLDTEMDIGASLVIEF